jgi:hypothetical protein
MRTGAARAMRGCRRRSAAFRADATATSCRTDHGPAEARIGRDRRRRSRHHRSALALPVTLLASSCARVGQCDPRRPATSRLPRCLCHAWETCQRRPGSLTIATLPLPCMGNVPTQARQPDNCHAAFAMHGQRDGRAELFHGCHVTFAAAPSQRRDRRPARLAVIGATPHITRLRSAPESRTDRAQPTD